MVPGTAWCVPRGTGKIRLRMEHRMFGKDVAAAGMGVDEIAKPPKLWGLMFGSPAAMVFRR